MQRLTSLCICNESYPCAIIFSFFKSRKSGIISSIVHFHKVCTGLSGNVHLYMITEILSYDAARYGSMARLASSF